jgi:hypothetical protein
VGRKDVIKEFQKSKGKRLPLVKPAEKCHKQAKNPDLLLTKKGQDTIINSVTD